MRASVVTCRDPFRPANHRSVDVVRRRRRLRALAPHTQLPVICQVNGQWMPRAAWSRRVQDGDLVVFVTLPQGGGGGSNPLKAVLMLAVAVFAPYAGSAILGIEGAAALGSVGVSIFNAAIGMIGSMLVNALIPAPKPTAAQQSASLAAASPTYSLGAQGNSARIAQPIPALYGRHLIYPDFAAMPYTEYAGNEQYLYELFVIGQGYYDIEAIRIEDTAIGNFAEVTTELVQPGGTVTLFPSRVMTSGEVSGQEATNAAWLGPFVANDAGTQANIIAIDVVMPRGLYYANDKGKLDAVGVAWTVQAQPIDDNGNALGGWATLGNESVSAATTTPIRNSYRYVVANGRYQVRLLRTDGKQTDSRYGHELDWAGLRTYLPGSQQYGDITLLAVRMRATNNLSSSASRRVNLIVTRKLPTWSAGGGWSAPVPTRSIAWAIADICRAAYGGGLPDSRIDLAGLAALDATWSARGDTFNYVADSQSTVMETLTIACRAGRAVPYLQGGIVHVVRDQPAALPVALFTPRNIVQHSLSIDYLMVSEETADAVDVTYFDEQIWAQRTVRAALPGSAQAVVAHMSLPGVTSRAQAWREGMYSVACNRYRRRLPCWQTEMEGFIPTLGDLVALQHDLPKWGQGGEIVAWNPTTREAVVSEPLTWTDNVAHQLAFRGRDGSVRGPYYAVPGSDTQRVILTDWHLSGTYWTDGQSDKATPDVAGDRERSHFSFGPVAAQYIRSRILTLRPRSSETVEIAAVIESDYVHTADTGAIPDATSWQLPTKVTVPVISDLSARSLPGNLTVVVLSWAPAAGADHYYVEQSSGDGHWTRVGDVGATSIATQALYGSDTVFRVAPIGLTQGAWRQEAYEELFSEVWNAGPQGFAASSTQSGVLLTWEPVLHLDVIGYRLFDQSGSKIGDVASTLMNVGYLSAGTHTWSIRAINRRGEMSPNAGTANVTIVAPHAPVVETTFSGPNLVLSWQEAESDQAIDRYRIRRGGTTWESAAELGETYSTTLTYRADWAGACNFWVAAIDKGGNIGAPALVTPVVTIPGQPAVTTQVIDNNVLLYWSDATRTLPIEAYEIRRGATWETAIRIGTKQGLFTVLFESVGGVFSYWIAGLDSAGNVGIPASISATVNEPPDYVLLADYYSTFSGTGTTLVNALYEEATVLLPVNTTETVAGHFDTRSWTSPDTQIAAGYPLYIQPSPANGYFEQVIDYGALLASNKITVTPTIETVAGSPVITCRISTSADGTTYTDVDNVTQLYASNFRFARVRISVAGGLCRMTDLNIRLDSKLRTMTGSLSVAAGDAGGTVVWMTDDKTASGTPLFVDIDSIQVTPRGTTAQIAIFDLLDAPYPTQFKILLYSPAGARVSGTVDYMVRGF